MPHRDPDRGHEHGLSERRPIWHDFGHSLMWTGMSDTIHVNTEPQGTFDIWSETMIGVLEEEDYTRALCQVAELAALILHEMLHGCLSIPGAQEVSDHPSECDHTYMLQSSFKWAIAQRFPCMTYAEDCSDWTDDEM